MAGGLGTRFWPISRKSMPKQFLNLPSTGKSMLRLTYDRMARLIPRENILVSTLVDYHDIVKKELPEISEENILQEVYNRNTAPCLYFAANVIAKRNPDAVMVACPADHLIEDNDDFEQAIEKALEYAAEHAEAASQAISGNYDIVMLPEPFVTSTLLQSSDFKVKLNLTEEWKKVANAELTMGCVAVRTDFLKENPEAVENFLKDYKTSVDFVNSDVEGAAALIEKYDIAKAAVAKKALPNCNIVLITGEDMKKDASQFLSIIYDFDASAVGGALPEDSFYYIGK